MTSWLSVHVFLALTLFGTTLATVETNKRGGHGIFHSIEDSNGKSSWLEEPKAENIKITSGNVNSLLSNTSPDSKKSSLYLQPEPRGLEYLLGVPDQSPFIFRKRDVSSDDNVNKMIIRRTRQINLGPGNVIPGSRNQAVLYGVPNGNVFPGSTNGNGFPGVPNGNGYPGLPNGNGFPGQSNVNGYPGQSNVNGYPGQSSVNGYPGLSNGNGYSGVSNGNLGPYQNGGLPGGINNANAHYGGYQTYGY